MPFFLHPLIGCRVPESLGQIMRVPVSSNVGIMGSNYKEGIQIRVRHWEEFSNCYKLSASGTNCKVLGKFSFAEGDVLMNPADDLYGSF